MAKKKTPKTPVSPPAPTPPIPKQPDPEPQIRVPRDLPDGNTNSNGTAPLPSLSEDQISEIDKELHLLNGKINEFVKCYLLLGYNFDGLPVQIISVKTQQDMDSLNHTLQRFLMNQAQRKYPDEGVESGS